jgi:hypothetical protein
MITLSGVFSTHHVYAQEMPLRYPLLELFTNTPCPICGNQDPGFFERLDSYEDQYHLVSFYPGTPYSSCIFYQANKAENETRWDFYPQLIGVPDVALNGIDFKSPNGVTTSVLDGLTGGTSWLAVRVSETDGVDRDVMITLENHGGASVESGTLFAVIVEREIMYDAPNGIDLHHNVFRKFLTPIEGEEVDLSGDVLTRMFEYSVDLDWQFDEVYIVAWVMDPETKEVLNSGTKFDEVVSSTRSITRAIELEVFPNPASEYLQVRIPEHASDEVRIYDSAGRLAHRTSALLEANITIPIADWAPGLYLVEVILENGVARGRFEVIR